MKIIKVITSFIIIFTLTACKYNYDRCKHKFYWQLEQYNVLSIIPDKELSYYKTKKECIKNYNSFYNVNRCTDTSYKCDYN